MKPLSIYIHIPFCVRKCLYCDFLSFPASPGQQEDYRKALLCEMERESSRFGDYQVETVFVGGGTPSLLSGDMVREIFSVLQTHYRLAADCEITMEANPGTLTLEKLAAYKKAGVNRLSIGLQSMDESELKALGRIHNREDFLRSYELAAEAGFTNLNVDLMSGLPGQTLAGYENTLRTVAELSPAPVHISAYSLILEEGTPFFDDPPELPSEEEERGMYSLTREVLAGYDYRRYEISNYAKPGFDCRHNQVYWRRGDYAGFGLGSSSMIDNVRYKNTSRIDSYVNYFLQAEKALRPIREDVNKLSLKEQMEEFMFLGLRMTKGVSCSEFLRLFGSTMDQIYPGVADRFCAQGLLQRHKEQGEEWISLTDYGMDVSNQVMMEFLL